MTTRKRCVVDEDFMQEAAKLREEFEARSPRLEELPEEDRKWIQSVGSMVGLMRSRRGMTIQALADRTGISYWWLMLLETGNVLPDELADDVLLKLGEALPSTEELPDANRAILFTAKALHPSLGDDVGRW